MKRYFIHNSAIQEEGAPVIFSSSRGMRYGDGFFETMLSERGKIIFKDLHFNRINNSMDKLGFRFNRKTNLETIDLKINQLLIKNQDLERSRIRLMFYRKEGGLFEIGKDIPDYTIETYSLETENKLNSNGLNLTVFKGYIKAIDDLSNIKCNNYLGYSSGARYAKLHKFNDSIILNMFGRVCDTCIANLFIIKKGEIFTPALEEGCIDGIYRKKLISTLNNSFDIVEGSVTVEDLENADEVFLTNAIKGIQWVKSIDEHNYSNKIIKQVYKAMNELL